MASNLTSLKTRSLRIRQAGPFSGSAAAPAAGFEKADGGIEFGAKCVEMLGFHMQGPMGCPLAYIQEHYSHDFVPLPSVMRGKNQTKTTFAKRA